MAENEAIEYVKEAMTYYDGKFEGGGHGDYYNAVVEMLEMRIPKKLTVMGDTARCPMCHYLFDRSMLVERSRRQCYCLNCGQRLDLSDME